MRVLRALALLLVVLLALGSLSTGPAAARPRQDPAETTTTAASTTTATDGEAEAEGAGSRRVADENRKIWLVVGGLVLVALALSLLTFRYWRHTRPVPLSGSRPSDDDDVLADELDDEELHDEDGFDDDEEIVPVPPRRSRRAVAGADHATVGDEWEPRGTGEHDRVDVSSAERVPRPTRDQRAAAYGRRR